MINGNIHDDTRLAEISSIDQALSNGLTLRTIAVRDWASSDLSPRAKANLTREAYSTLLKGIPHERLLRAWNFIPGITDVFDDDNDNDGITDDVGTARRNNDRYAAFNAGRFEAFQSTYTRDELKWFPAATGVGHSGNDIVLHLLHGYSNNYNKNDEFPIMNVAIPIDNPRQVKPEQYSEMFSITDLPPAFSRGAIIRQDQTEQQPILERGDDSSIFVVSGTASIIGEETVHVGSVLDQTRETLKNIDAVVSEGKMRDDTSSATVSLNDFTIYVDPRAFHYCNEIGDTVLHHFPSLIENNIMFREACMCRPDLLVEIESAGKC
mmetsp:Transcript_32361/g.68422  ORF Transcript_32361/g.68422 Transcript_32361/m.68422 type:complete len:323 (+) Transcript_32361:184-1152(+)